MIDIKIKQLKDTPFNIFLMDICFICNFRKNKLAKLRAIDSIMLIKKGIIGEKPALRKK